jgi:hypothetical protein
MLQKQGIADRALNREPTFGVELVMRQKERIDKRFERYIAPCFLLVLYFI